jgi:hypothetical protein
MPIKGSFVLPFTDKVLCNWPIVDQNAREYIVQEHGRDQGRIWVQSGPAVEQAPPAFSARIMPPPITLRPAT